MDQDSAGHWFSTATESFNQPTPRLFDIYEDDDPTPPGSLIGTSIDLPLDPWDAQEDRESVAESFTQSQTPASSLFPRQPATAPPQSSLRQASEKGHSPGGLNFLVGRVFWGNTTESYHAVQGRKRHGLIVDPGAASGIIGTDTLLEYQQEVLHYTNHKVAVRPSHAQFTGIDGCPTPGIGTAVIPLPKAPLQNASFTADLIGGPGSHCPGLLPLKALILYRAVLYNGIMDNGDGILQFNFMDKITGKPTCPPLLVAVLLTDSGHYLLPTDGRSPEPDQEVLRARVRQLLQPLLTDHKRAAPAKATKPQVVLQQTRSQAPSTSQAPDSPTSITTPRTGSSARISTTTPGRVQRSVSWKHPLQEIKNFGFSSARQNTNNNTTITETTQNLPVSLLPTPPGLINFQVNTNTDHFYNMWRRFKADRYQQDQYPMYIDGPEKHRLNKVYRALPEEFYTQSGLPVITPDNMHDFIKHMKENGHIFIFDLQELCSGSGRLSLTAFHKGMKVAFPVDLRYKWDTNNEEHQALLSEFFRTMYTLLKFWSPKCTPWSKSAIRKSQDVLLRERENENYTLRFIVNTCEHDHEHDMDFEIENPRTGDIWSKSALHDLDGLSRCRAKVVDQCRHGACIETGQLTRKSTILKGTTKMRRTALRCSCSEPHGELQGSFNGINRTAMAARFPKRMCGCMVADFQQHLRTKYGNYGNLIKTIREKENRSSLVLSSLQIWWYRT